MNTDRELMQQALGYMESVGQMDMHPEEWAIAVALRERLAQPVQEPVAAQHRFRHPQKGTPDWSVWQPCRVRKRPTWEIDSQGYEVEYRALYTAPQPRRGWVGLTEEEIERVCAPLGAAMLSFTEVARAIEAKLREKNA